MSTGSEIDLFSLHDIVEEPAVEALMETKDLGTKLNQVRLKNPWFWPNLVMLGPIRQLPLST
jgi:hypothetical protein